MKQWTPTAVALCRRSEMRVVTDPTHGDDMVEVDTVEALVQAVGYLKSQTEGQVYFRGQTRHHAPGCPLPQASRPTSLTTREHIYETIGLGASYSSLDPSDEVLLSEERPRGKHHLLTGDLPLYVVEPILQHYGLVTRWLDVTDSLPHALLFGLMTYEPVAFATQPPDPHDPRTLGHQASPFLTNEKVTRVDPDGHSYLYALSPGAFQRFSMSDRNDPLRGLSEHTSGHVIDMRVAAPSMFLRPHAQHGLLIKPKPETLDGDSLRPRCELLTAIFRIKRSLLLAWVGDGQLFDIPRTYPPVRRPAPGATGRSSEVDRGLFQVERALARAHFDMANPGLVTGRLRPRNDDLAEAVLRYGRLVNYVT